MLAVRQKATRLASVRAGRAAALSKSHIKKYIFQDMSFNRFFLWYEWPSRQYNSKRRGGVDRSLPELAWLSFWHLLCTLRGIFNSSQLSAWQEQPVESWTWETNCTIHQSAKKHHLQFAWDFNRTKVQHKYSLLREEDTCNNVFLHVW